MIFPISESTKAEIRRLRNVLTERGDYWDLQWDLPRLQTAYRHSHVGHPGINTKPCVLVSVLFEIISIDNFSHGYGATETDVSIVSGDPLAPEASDVVPLANEKGSNQIQLYLSMGELRGLCLHIVLNKLRSHIAFPLDDLLLTPAGQFPFESEISLWNIGTGVRTGAAKIRVKIGMNFSVAELGKSVSAVFASRNPRNSENPDQKKPDPKKPDPQILVSREFNNKRSLADPQLLEKRDSLRVRISELFKDNNRLRILIAQETNY